MLKTSGSTKLELMILAEPDAQVLCEFTSYSREVAVSPRVIVFESNTPARSLKSAVVRGLKDLNFEDDSSFEIAVQCQSTDSRFFTATLSVWAHVQDVQVGPGTPYTPYIHIRRRGRFAHM